MHVGFPVSFTCAIAYFFIWRAGIAIAVAVGVIFVLLGLDLATVFLNVTCKACFCIHRVCTFPGKFFSLTMLATIKCGCH